MNKTLGILWSIAINIFSLTIILKIFSITETRFEVVIFSILVMLYIRIHEIGINFGKNIAAENYQRWRNFNELRKMLKKIEMKQKNNVIDETVKKYAEEAGIDTGETSEEVYQDIEIELKEKVRLPASFWTDMVFSLIFLIIATFNLLRAAIFWG